MIGNRHPLLRSWYSMAQGENLSGGNLMNGRRRHPWMSTTAGACPDLALLGGLEVGDGRVLPGLPSEDVRQASLRLGQPETCSRFAQSELLGGLHILEILEETQEQNLAVHRVESLDHSSHTIDLLPLVRQSRW